MHNSFSFRDSFLKLGKLVTYVALDKSHAFGCHGYDFGGKL